MKYLTLMRHAKSDWGDYGLDDRERPLNERGKTAAPLMGKFLVENQIQPDQIFCSSAARTRETLQRMVDHFDPRPDISYEDELYLASPNTMLAVAKSAAIEKDHVLLLGHNPGTEMLAIALSNAETSAPESLSRIFKKFPTAGLAHFSFDVEDWHSIKERKGKLLLFETPKSIKSFKRH